MAETYRHRSEPDAERPHAALAGSDVIGDRHVMVLIGVVAVSATCLGFVVVRLAVTLQTGKATPWWANATSFFVVAGFYLWYRGRRRRGPGSPYM